MQCTMWQVLARSTAVIIEEAVLLAERVMVLTVIRDHAWTVEVGSSICATYRPLPGWSARTYTVCAEAQCFGLDGNALCSFLFSYAVLVLGPCHDPGRPKTAKHRISKAYNDLRHEARYRTLRMGKRLY
jgi:hypothetical protein